MATAALLRSLCRRELHATSVSASKSLSTNGKTSLIGKLGILARPFSSRPLWKGAFVDAFLMKMKKKKDLLLNKKIWSRRSSILPEFIDTSVRIYNGKTFVRAKITEGKVGHKFGEFAFTRKLRPKTNVGPGKKKGK